MILARDLMSFLSCYPDANIVCIDVVPDQHGTPGMKKATLMLDNGMNYDISFNLNDSVSISDERLKQEIMKRKNNLTALELINDLQLNNGKKEK